MNIELKRLKIAQSLSEETLAFTADIYLDGKKVGDVSNRGNGGCNLYYWNDKEAEKKITDFAVKTETEFNFEQVDTLLSKMIDNMEIAKKERRACKTKTAFRVKGQDKSVFYTINVPYSPLVKSQLEKKYGAELTEILNEKYK